MCLGWKLEHKSLSFSWNKIRSYKFYKFHPKVKLGNLAVVLWCQHMSSKVHWSARPPNRSNNFRKRLPEDIFLMVQRLVSIYKFRQLVKSMIIQHHKVCIDIQVQLTQTSPNLNLSHRRSRRLYFQTPSTSDSNLS